MVDTNTATLKVEKLQQHLEKLCGATIRATSGQPSFRFRGQRPELHGKSAMIRAPHLRPDFEEDNFRSFRGAADAIALRILHSDSSLHQQLMPESNIGQLIFELLEQLRCESLVSELHPGARKNLEHRFRQWCKQFCASDTVDNQLGLMIFTIAQVVWCRLTSLPMNHESEDLIEPMRMMIARHIGGALMGMRKNTTDQRVFAIHAHVIVEVLDSLLPEESDEKPIKDKKASLSTSNFSLYLEPNAEDDNSEITQAGKSPQVRGIREILEQLNQYQIFTTKNDEVVMAEKLALPAQLDKFCKVQDQLLKNNAVNIPKLARDLAKIIPGKQFSGWNFSQDEGYIDGSMLTTLITSPQYLNIFRTQQQLPNGNCVVSFLMDNSGSMKEHIQPISNLISILCKALEMVGANTEILGFTTKSWQGGKSHKQWMRSGKPENPGRLCETRHIIYKDADTKLQRAKRGIGAMLKLDLFKEGIDGEALLWAAKRLKQRSEQRKILIVLSDGCPMESASNQANTNNYLDNHLRQAASMIENTGEIELYALGFGLDLSPYYRHSLALEIPEKIENSIFKEILKMLMRRGV
ncbi:MAG: cobaltochelatase CobT [Oceanospirillaceae bacterium]|jgi:cobaltochelatase CobT